MASTNERRPIVAGNWKMNRLIGSAIDLAAEVKRRLSGFDAADVVLCPPFTALKSVGDLIRFGNVKLGAQDAHWEAEGAYTGEISISMLKDLACEYVILGHSERRAYFGETDESINRKARAVLVGDRCVDLFIPTVSLPRSNHGGAGGWFAFTTGDVSWRSRKTLTAHPGIPYTWYWPRTARQVAIEDPTSAYGGG